MTRLPFNFALILPLFLWIMRNSFLLMPYQAPQLETIVFQVESSFLDVSVRDVDASFSEESVIDGGEI